MLLFLIHYTYYLRFILTALFSSHCFSVYFRFPSWVLSKSLSRIGCNKKILWRIMTTKDISYNYSVLSLCFVELCFFQFLMVLGVQLLCNTFILIIWKVLCRKFLVFRFHIISGFSWTQHYLVYIDLLKLHIKTNTRIHYFGLSLIVTHRHIHHCLLSHMVNGWTSKK